MGVGEEGRRGRVYLCVRNHSEGGDDDDGAGGFLGLDGAGVGRGLGVMFLEGEGGLDGLGEGGVDEGHGAWWVGVDGRFGNFFFLLSPVSDGELMCGFWRSRDTPSA